METTLGAAYWVGLTVSLGLPLLVGLVTTRMTSGGLKATVLLLLSAVNGFLVEYQGREDGYVLGDAILLTLVSFVISVAMHFGLLKPTGVAAKAQAVGIRGGSGTHSA